MALCWQGKDYEVAVTTVTKECEGETATEAKPVGTEEEETKTGATPVETVPSTEEAVAAVATEVADGPGEQGGSEQSLIAATNAYEAQTKPLTASFRLCLVLSLNCFQRTALSICCQRRHW